MFTSSEIHVINILRNGAGYRNATAHPHYTDSDLKIAIALLLRKGIIEKAKNHPTNWLIDNHILTDYGDMYPL